VAGAGGRSGFDRGAWLLRDVMQSKKFDGGDGAVWKRRRGLGLILGGALSAMDGEAAAINFEGGFVPTDSRQPRRWRRQWSLRTPTSKPG